MTPDIDLWTGKMVEIEDDAWVPYTYADDAVQFIHRDDHTQIWQGRTVVSREFTSGRIESHYSHSAEVVFLVAATAHNRPPEREEYFDEDEFVFDFDELDEPIRTSVLETLLAEWASTHRIAMPDYPAPETLDDLQPLTTDSSSATSESDDPTGQDLFNAGVANIESGSEHTT